MEGITFVIQINLEHLSCKMVLAIFVGLKLMFSDAACIDTISILFLLSIY